MIQSFGLLQMEQFTRSLPVEGGPSCRARPVPGCTEGHAILQRVGDLPAWVHAATCQSWCFGLVGPGAHVAANLPWKPPEVECQRVKERCQKGKAGTFGWHALLHSKAAARAGRWRNLRHSARYNCVMLSSSRKPGRKSCGNPAPQPGPCGSYTGACAAFEFIFRPGTDSRRFSISAMMLFLSAVDR